MVSPDLKLLSGRSTLIMRLSNVSFDLIFPNQFNGTSSVFQNVSIVLVSSIVCFLCLIYLYHIILPEFRAGNGVTGYHTTYE